jgi:hypothetical protein
MIASLASLLLAIRPYEVALWSSAHDFSLIMACVRRRRRVTNSVRRNCLPEINRAGAIETDHVGVGTHGKNTSLLLLRAYLAGQALMRFICSKGLSDVAFRNSHVLCLVLLLMVIIARGFQVQSMLVSACGRGYAASIHTLQLSEQSVRVVRVIVRPKVIFTYYDTCMASWCSITCAEHNLAAPQAVYCSWLVRSCSLYELSHVRSLTCAGDERLLPRAVSSHCCMSNSTMRAGKNAIHPCDDGMFANASALKHPT